MHRGTSGQGVRHRHERKIKVAGRGESKGWGESFKGDPGVVENWRGQGEDNRAGTGMVAHGKGQAAVGEAQGRRGHGKQGAEEKGAGVWPLTAC